LEQLEKMQEHRPLIGAGSRGSLLDDDSALTPMANTHMGDGQRNLSRQRLFSAPLIPMYQDHNSVLRKDFTTIDWSLQRYQDKVSTRKVRDSRMDLRPWKRKLLLIYDNLQTFFVILLVGVATAISAYGIHVITDFLQGFRLGYCHNGLFVSRSLCCLDQPKDCPAWQTWAKSAFGGDSSGGEQFFNFIVYTFWAVLYASGAAWLVFFYQHYSTGSGLPYLKTILGGFIVKGFLGARTLTIKSFSLILTVASGLNLGKEGPIIHIAACWANVFARKFDKFRWSDVRRREVYTAAISAGVAAAFGAPMGGVIFGIEALSSYFDRRIMWQSLSCAVVSVVVLVAMNPFQNDTVVQFQVLQKHDWHWIETIPFAFIGICGGAVGAGCIKS
jgi:chloride channel 3/4/5